MCQISLQRHEIILALLLELHDEQIFRFEILGTELANVNKAVLRAKLKVENAICKRLQKYQPYNEQLTESRHDLPKK